MAVNQGRGLVTEPTKTEKVRENGGGERGTQYPADNLETAITMVGRVRTAIGFSPAKREIIAEALGYKTLSGHASRKLGTLNHYGLLERSGKGAARISVLGKAILTPTSEAERQHAITDAAKQPNLYAALITKYAEQGLPTLLPNLLIREHGVHPSVAEAAAATFRETVEYAGLLRNGVLYAEAEEPPSASDGIAGDGRSPHDSSGGDRGRNSGGTDSGSKRHDQTGVGNAPGFTIPLDNSGRMATIHIPLPVSKRDLKKIGAWLNYMNAVVDDEEETPSVSGN